MGLAPYGQPRFVDRILSELLDLKEDGSFRLNLRYFDFVAGLSMTNEAFAQLFEDAPRKPETEITQRHKDVARSIQAVTEEVMLRMARHAHALVGTPNLCLAGGVALNCVANAGVLRHGPFKNIWIQPAAGDAGGAIGAALAAWHHYCEKPRANLHEADAQSASLLGPAYDANEFLRQKNIPHTSLSEDELMSCVTTLLEQGGVVGWYQGRMEFGPRALGNRSILADARRPEMQEKLNRKIKFRESFRPFAPAVLLERVADYFEFDRPSPYMLFTAPVRPSATAIPAVTHVDGSARLQTVAANENPRFHRLLCEFEKRTGCAVLVNTSFNLRGEPPVCTPQDAFRCFMRSGMDYLVLDHCVLDKREQAASPETSKKPRFHWTNSIIAQIDSSSRSLRHFGYTIGSVLFILAVILIYRERSGGWLLATAALAFGIAGQFAPRALIYLHRAWMLFALTLGWLMTRIILSVVFFLAVTPVGLVQRLSGKRPIDFGFRSAAETSYWRRREAHVTVDSYEKQF